MATQTRTISDAPALVTYDYDDVTFFVTAVDITNTTVYPLPVTATVNKNGRTFSHITPSGQTFHQDIPTTAAARMEVFVDPTNNLRLDGVTWQIG